MEDIDLEQLKNMSNFADSLVQLVKEQGVNGVQRAFRSYDIDDSGTITRDELKSWMTSHGRFLTKRQVQQTVDAVDINGDGVIDYSEFLVRNFRYKYSGVRISHQVHNSSSQDFWENFANFFWPNVGEIWLKIGKILLNFWLDYTYPTVQSGTYHSSTQDFWANFAHF